MKLPKYKARKHEMRFTEHSKIINNFVKGFEHKRLSKLDKNTITSVNTFRKESIKALTTKRSLLPAANVSDSLEEDLELGNDSSESYEESKEAKNISKKMSALILETYRDKAISLRSKPLQSPHLLDLRASPSEGGLKFLPRRTKNRASMYVVNSDRASQ